MCTTIVKISKTTPPPTPLKKYPPQAWSFSMALLNFPTQMSSKQNALGGLRSRVEGCLWVWVGWCLWYLGVFQPRLSQAPCPPIKVCFSVLCPRGRRLGEAGAMQPQSFFFSVICLEFGFLFFFWRSGFFLLGPGLPSRSPRAKDFKLVGRSHIILNSSLK